jgi:hypothetical protein
MQPSSLEAPGHDLSPKATPGRGSLPRWLVVLPPMAVLASALALITAALSFRDILVRNDQHRLLEVQRAGLSSQAEALRARLVQARSFAQGASGLAEWVAGGCSAQGFLLDTLTALPGGAGLNRLSVDLAPDGTQIDVQIEFMTTPEAAQTALANAEAAWARGGLRVSAREPAVAGPGRSLFRLSLSLPARGRSAKGGAS